jgi:hypothetical protein
MESKHPEAYFNKLKLSIKLVKILREKFCVFIFIYTYLRTGYTWAPKI